MAKEFAKRFYKSKAWQKCRAGFIRSKFGLCEKCGSPGYIVHHKERLTPDNINDHNVTLNWNKLMYLCIECHNAIDCESKPTREGLAFDKNGNLIEVGAPYQAPPIPNVVRPLLGTGGELSKNTQGARVGGCG